MTLLELFGTFFYIGLFTIGGGVVAITLMQQTIVSKGIISLDQFYNMVAISESTPGPLGTNMATYIGYKLYGVPGALVTTIGEALPSIIIIFSALTEIEFGTETPVPLGKYFIINVTRFNSVTSIDDVLLPAPVSSAIIT